MIKRDIYIKPYSLLLLPLFFFALGNWAYGANEQPSYSPTPLMLNGKVCIGADQLDGCGFSPSMRCWFNDRTAFEAVIGGYETGAIGLGVIQNIAHPQRDVYVHLLSRATFANFESFPQTNAPIALTYFSFTLGIGFEAFMPFCENLSLDGWVGEQIYTQRYAGNYTDFRTMLDSFGSPFNLAIHAYF